MTRSRERAIAKANIGLGVRPKGRSMGRQDTKYLLICNSADGFFALFNGVVIQLQLARRLGLQPIVYMHKRSYMFGSPNLYFEEREGPNVWDYYYEPIGPSQADLKTLVQQGKVFTVSTASELFRLFRWDPRSWFINPYGYYRSVENRADGPYPAAWWRTQRERVGVFLQDGTIRFNASVRRQIDLFVEEHFTKPTLGLQLRGSDKRDYGSGPNLGRKVTPEEYFPHIDRYLAQHPDSKIFVATDQRQWLKVLEAAYPGKIISSSEASLSDDNQNRLYDADNKAGRGREVLVDAILLSRCNHLLKCHAAVGELALAFNPDLPFVDLNYERQSFKVRNALGYAILAPSIWLLCLVWRSLAENGMSVTKVVSVEGDHITVDPSQVRPLNVKESYDVKAPRSPVLSRRFVSDAFDRLVNILADRCFKYEPLKSDR